MAPDLLHTLAKQLLAGECGVGEFVSRVSASANAGDELPGITTVDVDLDTKVVTVTGDSVDRDAVVAAIDEAGYEVAGATG